MKLTLSSALGIVFVTLKLSGIIGWSWWWVTAPFWWPFAAAFFVIFGCAIYSLVVK